MNGLERPRPAAELCEEWRHPERFVPAPEVTAWIREVFLDRWGALYNPAHEHLALASIDVLWTNVINTRQMRTAVATAELPEFRGLPWVKARQEQQLVDWFGRIPDFLLTFDAPLTDSLDDASWCAVVEHELYHCAQRTDQYGSPKWHRDGTPVFGIRGHDVEEFVGVVQRYGALAAGPQVQAMLKAAGTTPLVAGAVIATACGTCAAKAA